MSLTEFAMVDELAFLIKDNLRCKHLVLTMEEALVDFLQDNTSSNGVLELEPMDSYSRLLLHRLADIFGFSHQSVGEGDDRHLVLERCPETSIPSILVSDLLWQYDEYQGPTISQILSRTEEASPELKIESRTSQLSLEEREAAYLAARQRIFTAGEGRTDGPVRPKPRGDPVVARRMIAHALGQRIKPPNQVICNKDGAKDLFLESFKERKSLDREKHLDGEQKLGESNGSALSEKGATKIGSSGERKVQKINLKEEHVGAAKRMFANALGFNSTRANVLSKCGEANRTNKGKPV